MIWMSWPANSFRWGFEPAVEFGHFGLHRFEAREDARSAAVKARCASIFRPHR